MKEESEKEMNSLSHVLKQYHKDQISLSNLKIKLQALTENIKKMRQEKAELEVKFQALLEKINSVKTNYKTVTREVQRTVEQKNESLQSRLAKLGGSVEEKENELAYIMVGSSELVSVGSGESYAAVTVGQNESGSEEQGH